MKCMVAVLLALVIASNAFAQTNPDSILNYGVVAGTCANTSAIATNNSSIQTAFNSGGNIYFPPGNYPFTALGFNIPTSGQHIYGAKCTGTGTASPVCPSSIQDCSPDMTLPDCNSAVDNCGYLSVRAPHVEINDLKIQGNTHNAGTTGTSHKGIYGTGAGNDNLYVHDVFVTQVSAEAIYSDGAGANTRFIHNTITDSATNGLNTNNYDMTNVWVTDNTVVNVATCMLIAANDFYALRNTCEGTGVISGGDAVNIVAPSFFVFAYNTINMWDSACCAISILHVGFTPPNVTGPGVVAYNTITNNLLTAIPGAGSVLQINRVTGPVVFAHNTITFNGNTGATVPGIMVEGDATDAVLISDNTLNGNASTQPIGIQIYTDVPTPNRVQINSSNTYGTTPTPTQFLVAPTGAPMSVFQPVIDRALPYLPDGLPISQFGQLTAVPTHPTPGIQLSWAGATATVQRWVDGGVPTAIGTASGTYLDSTAVANTIYYYNITDGVYTSNTAVGVVSDITTPFKCPFIPQAANLGVDRTERFQSADGSTVSFTIRVPVTTSTVTVPPCNGAVGCSDYANINALTSTNGTKIQLQAGDYHLSNAWTSGFLYNIFVNGNDIEVDGAVDTNGIPLTYLYFNRTASAIPTGLVMSGNRFLFKNFIIDWDFPNAIPGVVNNAGANQRFSVGDPHNAMANGAYYIPNPAFPPDIKHLNGYRLGTRTYDLRSGARLGINSTGFNPNFAVDGLYWYGLAGSNNLPDGTEAIFFVNTGHAIDVGAAANDVSFENVRVYGGGSAGLVHSSQSKGLRLSNFAITRKPDSILASGEQPRYVSLIGDSDANYSFGNIVIENSEMGYVDDDSFYMRGLTFQPDSGSLTTSSFTITQNFSYALPTEQVRFIDPITLAQVGPTTTATVTNSGAGPYTWTFSFAAVPELASYVGKPMGAYPVIGLVNTSVPNFIIRDSCFHDNSGRIFPKNGNGLITNNVFGNSYYGPIELSVDPTAPGFALMEGPGPSNIIISNNKIVGSNSGTTDLATIWAPTVVSNGYFQTGWASGAIFMYGIGGDGFSPTGYPFKNIQIYDNFISSTTGLCITVIGGNNVSVIRNTCVDANSVPFTSNFSTDLCGGHSCCGSFSQGTQPSGANQPWCLAKVAAQGAIMVSHSKNVDTKSNIFLGTSAGLFTDTPTVNRDLITGLRFQ